MEVKPLAKITQQNVKDFVWKSIVCKFRIPRVLVSNNGWQFDNTPSRDFCEQLGIKNHYSSPSHPQAHGQAKVANRSLLKIIKTRLRGAKKVWPDELPGVLWAYRMTVRTLTREILFKLAHWSSEYSTYWFSVHHQLAPSVGKVIFMFCSLSFSDKRLHGSDKIKGH